MIYITTRREGIHMGIVDEPNGRYSGVVARGTFLLNLVLTYGRGNIQRGHEAIFMNFKKSSELEGIFEDIFLGNACENLAKTNSEVKKLLDHVGCNTLYKGITNKNFGLAFTKHLDNMYYIREQTIYYLYEKDAVY